MKKLYTGLLFFVLPFFAFAETTGHISDLSKIYENTSITLLSALAVSFVIITLLMPAIVGGIVAAISTYLLLVPTMAGGIVAVLVILVFFMGWGIAWLIRNMIKPSSYSGSDSDGSIDACSAWGFNSGDSWGNDSSGGID